MIEDATVDAHDEEEQAVGFLTMLEENLRLPFKTIVLGVPVTVERMDLETDEIVAVCHRGKNRQAIPLVSLAPPLSPSASRMGVDRGLPSMGARLAQVVGASGANPMRTRAEAVASSSKCGAPLFPAVPGAP